MGGVDGFVPSTRGFRFPNAWPHVHAFSVRVHGVDVEVGNAAKGLCGGMVFAARDYFEADLAVPGDTVAPGSGPLLHYVGSRLKDSFDLPLGPTKYLEYMAIPDGDKAFGFLSWLTGKRVRGIAWRTIREEVPKIVADLDSGRLSCLGLVCARGANPMDLGENHQVLAYRYEASADDMRLWVYDPNRPGRDDVCLTFSTANPAKASPIEFVNGSKSVRGFFRVAYRRSQPPTPDK